MSRAGRVVAMLVLCAAGAVAGMHALHAASPAAPADFSGMWLPDARRAEPWPDALPLAPVARRFMESFNPAESDPTTFCMPFGTPRNMLQTGYPLEIAQTPELLLMIIQPDLANAEVRRIALDGGAPAQPAEPSWFGTSRGHWEGSTLVVETVGLREDAIISGNGLPHSRELRVIERLHLEDEPGEGKVLVDDIELHDPQAYLEPLKTRRYFSRAPNARHTDSSCVEALWTAKLWRDRLQEHAEAARRKGAQ